MGKKTINKNNLKGSIKAAPRPQEAKRRPNYLPWFLKNICAAVIAGFILSKCIDLQEGYNWVCNNMLKGNMELIKANRGATLEQRTEFKLGFDYQYLLFIRNATPEDAVILYPSAQDFFPEGIESRFKQDVSNRIWALRFLYPRRLVLAREMERYAGRITHVAIVNGRGYERLGYEAEEMVEFGIFPLNN